MNGARSLLLALLVVLLAACGSNAPRLPSPVQDRAPATTDETERRLASLPDPEVKQEPKSKWGNGPVYTVFGKSYRVMESARGFRQEGTASWYGTKFHGRRTSNGETFDIYKLTAAHKHLPLPTYVRVTNLENGRHTVVRVNDRGPFHGDRIIDLSYAAAVKLGFHAKGVARVAVEVLEPAPPAPEQVMLQAGAFTSLANADRAVAQIAQLTGYSGVVVKTPTTDLYRVRLGPVAGDAELRRVRLALEANGYGAPRVFRVD